MGVAIAHDKPPGDFLLVGDTAYIPRGESVVSFAGYPFSVTLRPAMFSLPFCNFMGNPVDMSANERLPQSPAGVKPLIYAFFISALVTLSGCGSMLATFETDTIEEDECKASKFEGVHVELPYAHRDRPPRTVVCHPDEPVEPWRHLVAHRDQSE